MTSHASTDPLGTMKSDSVPLVEPVAAAILRSAVDPVVVVTADGKILAASSTVASRLGWPSTELLGQGLELLLPGVRAAELGERVSQFVERADVRCQDGSKLTCEMSVAVPKGAELFVVTFHEVGDREEAERMIIRKTLQAELLNRSVEMVSQARSFVSIVEESLTLVCDALGWDLGQAFEVQGDELSTIEQMGVQHVLPDLDRVAVDAFLAETKGAKFVAGAGLPGLVVEGGMPICVPDVRSEPRVQRNDTLVAAGLRGAFAFPITMQGRVVAVLEFFSREEIPFDQSLVTLMTNIGDQLGHAYERHLANRNLVEAKTMAEAANVSKSEFLANMSHELRTPLTAILGFTEVLSEAVHFPDSVSENLEHLRTIQRNGEHLLELINSILDLSKIESGRMELEMTPTYLDQLLHSVEKAIGVAARGKGLELSIEFASPVPAVVHTDPTRLRQVLLNLLGNAVKFTESGSVRAVVQFDAERDPNIQIDVVDSGIGMTAEQAAVVFDKFAQADCSTTRNYGGTGLGLTISRELARLLGGDLIVAKSAPGAGTTMRLTLSGGEVTAGERIVVPPAQTTVTQLPRAAEPPPPEVEAPSVTPPGDPSAPIAGKILLVEDGVDNQRLLKYVLEREGFAVSVAGNGRLGLEAAAAAAATPAPFDLVLMDMQMPEMDGYAATRALRESGYDRPIVALTAHAMRGDREKCLAAGCNDYQTKPVHREELLRVVRRFLAERAS